MDEKKKFTFGAIENLPRKNGGEGGKGESYYKSASITSLSETVAYREEWIVRVQPRRGLRGIVVSIGARS